MEFLVCLYAWCACVCVCVRECLSAYLSVVENGFVWCTSVSHLLRGSTLLVCPVPALVVVLVTITLHDLRGSEVTLTQQAVWLRIRSVVMADHGPRLSRVAPVGSGVVALSALQYINHKDITAARKRDDDCCRDVEDDEFDDSGSHTVDNVPRTQAAAQPPRRALFTPAEYIALVVAVVLGAGSLMFGLVGLWVMYHPYGMAADASQLASQLGIVLPQSMAAQLQDTYALAKVRSVRHAFVAAVIYWDASTTPR